MQESQFVFENKDNFNLLLIKPNKIDHLDWLDSLYTDNISKENCYEVIKTNPENFVKDITYSLLIDKYNTVGLEVAKQIICEIPDYIYELLYVKKISDIGISTNIDIFDVNEIASLLNTCDEKIYGNTLLLKTYLPTLSKTMILSNIDNNDIKTILDNRVKTKVVIYDGEFKEEYVVGDLETYAKEFFDDTWNKLEIPFLLHNINIWYDTLECKMRNTICGKIINKPVYKCIWFTMINDEFRGSLSLSEVEKIIKLSYKLEYPYIAKLEWIEDEKDEFNRDIIKNKYRVLELAYTNML
jgi:hypothetical protein